MSASTSETEGTRATTKVRSHLPPTETGTYTLVEVEFSTNGKLYTYWAPCCIKLQPGDVVKVDTCEKPFSFDLKEVRVRTTVEGRFDSHVRACKRIHSVVRRVHPSYKARYAKDVPRDRSTLLTELAAVTFGKTPDAVTTTGEAIDFKAGIVNSDLSEVELRAITSLSTDDTPDIVPDIYKQLANRYRRDAEAKVERFMGMHPALGMGYNIAARPGQVLTMEDLRNQMKKMYHAGQIVGIPNRRFATIKPKEAPVELKINTITYVNGQDVYKLTAEQQFELVSQAENEIRKLSTLVNKPKSVDKRIAELEEGIAGLLRAADGEDAAPYKSVLAPPSSNLAGDAEPTYVTTEGMAPDSGL